MTERIKTLEQNGKTIVYFDLSDIKSNDELSDVVRLAREAMARHQHGSVYTITNISRITFDSKTKSIAAEWMAFNKPYVVNAAFIGASGVRKIMMGSVFTLSGRKNVKMLNDMEHALEWIGSL